MGDRGFSRLERVGDQIARTLAELIATEVSDPRASNLTVSGVEVSRDLRNARVFVTPAAGADPEETVKAINGAAGFLRKRLGEQVRLKYLPRLRFEYDSTLDRADRLDALINDARKTSGSPAQADTTRDESPDRRSHED